jgi:hypothetical protein
MARKAAVSPDVFVNVPFDPGYEPLFVALIAGLTAFGAAPRSVVELDPGERRLDRLIKHIHACGASVSDLSRVQTSRSGKHTVPRFNMPFELGLIVNYAKTKRGPEHRWFVLEERPHRIKESLTDLDGTDVFIHHGKAERVVLFVQAYFGTTGALPSKPELVAHLATVKKIAKQIKKRWESLFSKGPFGELVYEARRAWEERIAPSNERARQSSSATKSRVR